MHGSGDTSLGATGRRSATYPCSAGLTGVSPEPFHIRIVARQQNGSGGNWPLAPWYTTGTRGECNELLLPRVNLYWTFLQNFKTFNNVLWLRSVCRFRWLLPS
jgi:hypothetical protein